MFAFHMRYQMSFLSKSFMANCTLKRSLFFMHSFYVTFQNSCCCHMSQNSQICIAVSKAVKFQVPGACARLWSATAHCISFKTLCCFIQSPLYFMGVVSYQDIDLNMHSCAWCRWRVRRRRRNWLKHHKNANHKCLSNFGVKVLPKTSCLRDEELSVSITAIMHENTGAW